MHSPRERLAQMSIGHWQAQMVYVAARLQIADRLHAGPQTVETLAAETRCDPRALHRLLRALASLGVFAEGPARVFALTEIAHYLRDDHPETVRPLVLMMGDTQYHAWGDLYESVQTGAAAFPKRYGRPLFDHLAEHPEQAEIFDRAMVAIHGRETAGILAAYDFSAFSTLVDVGGGNASQLIEILRRYPALRGTVYDLPHVAARARAALADAGLSGRADACGGSFFESAPAGADAYVLRHILHDWSDDESRAILARVRAAIPPHGKLLVIETVIPPGNEPCFAKLLDLTMLLVPGGLERTSEEYEELFREAGFRLARIVPTPAGVDVIEAVPA